MSDDSTGELGADPDVTAFLLARLAEAEQIALADIAAKRGIIEDCADTIATSATADPVALAYAVLYSLAQPFADHPDHHPTWLP